MKRRIAREERLEFVSASSRAGEGWRMAVPVRCPIAGGRDVETTVELRSPRPVAAAGGSGSGGRGR